MTCTWIDCVRTALHTRRDGQRQIICVLCDEHDTQLTSIIASGTNILGIVAAWKNAVGGAE